MQNDDFERIAEDTMDILVTALMTLGTIDHPDVKTIKKALAEQASAICIRAILLTNVA